MYNNVYGQAYGFFSQLMLLSKLIFQISKETIFYRAQYILSPMPMGKLILGPASKQIHNVTITQNKTGLRIIFLREHNSLNTSEPLTLQHSSKHII